MVQQLYAVNSRMVSYPEVIHFTRDSARGAPRPSRPLLPTNLPLFTRCLQLPIPLGVDLRLTTGEHVLRRDEADGTVQADVVVMLDVALHQTPRIFQRQGRSRPDALPFERFVPSFDFPVRLGIVRRRSDMGHAGDPNKLLEVLGDELWPVVGDDPGSRLRVLFLRCL